MVTSRDQNAGRSHFIKIDSSSFERMEEIKYLGKTLTNQTTILEEIKSRLKSENACYYSVHNLCLPVCYPKISRLTYTEMYCSVWVWKVVAHVEEGTLTEGVW